MVKKKIYRAGMVPYYIKDETIFMLFMRPSDPKFGTFSYQVCKGKVEENELPMEAALREAEEEIGLKISNICGEVHHIGTVLGRTDIYVCKIEDPLNFSSPSTPEEVESTKWMTPEEFQQTGRGLHKPIIRTVIEYIKSREGIINERE